MPTDEENASKVKGREFNDFLGTLSQKEIEEGNERVLRKTQEDYDRFLKAYSEEKCSLCGSGLSEFDRNAPCLHWLTRPAGFKAKDVRMLGARFGLRRLQAYLHWISSTESFAKGINDLSSEGKTGMIVNETIRWRDAKYTIQCGENDYIGHGKNSHSQQPHYHLQILYDGNMFCKFSQHHLPLSHMDIVYIEAARTPGSKVRKVPAGPVTMEDVFSTDPETMLDNLISTDNEDEAMLNIDTIVQADAGETISGDDLATAIEQAREKGSSIAAELKGLKKASVSVQMTPGPGVVEKAERTGGRGTKRGCKASGES
jgi:hypothetical protein